MVDIAYLGLGIMGRGMVRNLLRAGHTVHAWNRSAVDLPEEIAQHPNFIRAASVAEAAEGRDIVMLCLTGPAAQRAVLLDPEGGVLAHAARGALILDASTSDPATARDLAAAAEAVGMTYLDTPVYGSKPHAWDGTLGFVCGGPAEALERARPILEPLSAHVHHLGPVGAGATMKLIGNLLFAAQVTALGEGLSIARKAGLLEDGVIGVLDNFGASSGVIRGLARSTLKGDYTPTFYLKHLLKDARLVIDHAHEAGIPVPATAVTAELLQAAVNAGWGELHASALHKLFFRLSGLEE